MDTEILFKQNRIICINSKLKPKHMQKVLFKIYFNKLKKNIIKKILF